MKKKTDRSREKLLVFIMVILLLIIAWLLINKNHSTIQDNKVTVTNNAEQKGYANDKQIQKDGISYLVVKEWGIKIPEEEGNKIDYKIGDGSNYAYFVSEGQRALGGDCGTFGFARYMISRIENVDISRYNGWTQENLKEAEQDGRSIKINNIIYYIIGDMTAGVCTDDRHTLNPVSQEEIKANTNLLNALKKLSPLD